MTSLRSLQTCVSKYVMNALRNWVRDRGGAVSAPDLADELGVSRARTRDWAATNDVPRIGQNYAFTLEHAEAFAEEIDLDRVDQDYDQDEDDDALDEDD